MKAEIVCIYDAEIRETFMFGVQRSFWDKLELTDVKTKSYSLAYEQPSLLRYAPVYLGHELTSETLNW